MTTKLDPVKVPHPSRRAGEGPSQASRQQAAPQRTGARLGSISPIKALLSGTSPVEQPRLKPVDAITKFIELEVEARRCADLDALRFAIANSPRVLADFEQAFLVEPSLIGGWSITRASSVAAVDRNAPLVRAIATWLANPRHAEALGRAEPRRSNIEQETALWGITGHAFPLAHAFWLPITARDGRVLAALLALRKEEWDAQHMALLMPLAEAYGHAWDALAPADRNKLSRAGSYLSRKPLALAAGLVSAIALFAPVNLTTLAPAEIVAGEPSLVTAPMDGVISDILVPPGTWVGKDTPIVKFVDVRVRNEYEVANRNLAVADARYFKSVQTATAAQKDLQDVAIAKAELDVAKAEYAYAADMLARSEVRAQNAGLLIYSAKTDWLGKPIATGERIMEIGDPAKTEVRIDLPVSDAIVLKPGSRVALFLDGDPLHALSGIVTRTGYRPLMSIEQQLVFRIFARLDDGQAGRIGLRGVARVSGDRAPLWFYLLRRPIAALRQKVGL